MELTKKLKARNADVARTETLNFRMSKRLRSLADLGARASRMSVAHYTETALEDKLASPLSDLHGQVIEHLEGKSIKDLEGELYDDDDFLCFQKRFSKHQWAFTSAQHRIVRLIQASPLLTPKKGSWRWELIREHWIALAALETVADAASLPAKVFQGVDLEFALMNEHERKLLFQADQETFIRRSHAFLEKGKR